MLYDNHYISLRYVWFLFQMNKISREMLKYWSSHTSQMGISNLILRTFSFTSIMWQWMCIDIFVYPIEAVGCNSFAKTIKQGQMVSFTTKDMHVCMVAKTFQAYIRRFLLNTYINNLKSICIMDVRASRNH